MIGVICPNWSNGWGNISKSKFVSEQIDFLFHFISQYIYRSYQINMIGAIALATDIPTDFRGNTLKYTYGDLTRNYYSNDTNYSGKSLKEIYQEAFYIDDYITKEDDFNRKQKLYIVAEEISPIIREVSEHLRATYKVNINHLEYQVLRTKVGEYLLSVEKTLGFDINRNSNIKSGVSISSSGWNGNGNEKVKDIIYREVLAFTKGNRTMTFAPKDIIK